METDYKDTHDKPYMAYRKEAGKYNDRLNSGEKAAELLGISEASLRKHENGITKVVPNDVVHDMADLYNAPELRSWYCNNECPIGKTLLLATEVRSVQSIAINFLNVLPEEKIRELARTLITISADNQICESEKDRLRWVSSELSKAAVVIHEIYMLAQKNGCAE